MILFLGGLAVAAFGSLVATGAWAAFMLYRNSWVYRARQSVLHDPDLPLEVCMYEYDRLPPYETMLKKFWVWDLDKFMSTDPDRRL